MSKSTSRWFIVPFAFCLSLCLMISFAPLWKGVHSQIDFLLLWCVALLLTALPMLYLEVALAKRSQTTAIQALMSLTREADAPTFWRVLGWGGALFISFLAGGLIKLSSVQLMTFVPNLGIGLVAILMLVALALSFLPRMITLGLVIIGLIVSPFLAPVTMSSLQWTNIAGVEWAIAVMLALFSTGLGMGVYWQNSLHQQDSSSSATPKVWLILFALLIAGVIFAVLPMNYTLANIALAGILLQLARQQWIDRKMALPIAGVLSLSTMLIWLIPIEQILVWVAVIWGLLLCLVYSIFAGWVMKASHLRKALNFSNELVYNLWRVAVRIIVPINIIVAFVLLIRG